MSASEIDRSRHLPIRPQWLALRREAIIDPALPIIDPHHHLWDRPDHRYLLTELLEDVGSGHNVRATVFLEVKAMYRADGDPAMRPVGETEFVNGIAAMAASGNYGPCRACAGIVGNADLRLGSRVRSVLEAHIAAGGGRFRGVRTHAAYHENPMARGVSPNAPKALLADRSFREGFACLQPLGLSFETWMYHPQIPELTDLAAAFPDTTIILNHIGAPIGVGPYAGKSQDVFAEWSASLRALARHPNVSIKLGGMGMWLFGYRFHEAALPPSSEELAEAWKPYLEACISIFGANRCMFESNFPVDKGMCSYPVLWNAFKRVAAGCSPAERAALFSGTAARVYRISLEG